MYDHDRLTDCQPQEQPFLGVRVSDKEQTPFAICLKTPFCLFVFALVLRVAVLVQDRSSCVQNFSVCHAHLGLKGRLHERKKWTMSATCRNAGSNFVQLFFAGWATRRRMTLRTSSRAFLTDTSRSWHADGPQQPGGQGCKGRCRFQPYGKNDANSLVAALSWPKAVAFAAFSRSWHLARSD